MKTRVQFTVVVTLLSALVIPTFAADPVIPDEWKAMKTDELIALAKTLVAQGDQGAEARGTLVAHLDVKYMGGDAAAKSVTIQQWRNFVGLLGKDIPAEVKARWVVRLRSAFAGDTESLVALDGKDDPKGWMRRIDEFVRLLSALGDKKTNDVRTAVTLATLSVDQLVVHAGRLKTTGQTGAAAKAALAKHLNDKYLVSDAAAKTITIQKWRYLVGGLGEGLSAEAKAQWVVRLRSTFAGDKEKLVALNAKIDPKGWMQYVAVFERLLSELGDKNAKDVRTAVTLATLPELSTMSADKLVAHASNMGRAGDAAASGRGDVVAHLSSKYLASDAAAKSLTLKQWGSLAGSLDKQLSAEVKAQWVTKLRSAFAGSKESLAALNVQPDPKVRRPLDDLVGLLGRLGDKKTGEIRTAVLLATRPDPATLSADKLLAHVGRMRGAGDAGGDARQEIVTCIASKYLASDANAKLLTVPQWVSLVGQLDKELSGDMKARLVTRLRTAFAGSKESLVALSLKFHPSDMRPIVNAFAGLLGRLGDKKTEEIRKAVLVAARPDPATLSADKLVVHASAMHRIGDTAAGARGEIIAHIGTKYLVSDAAAKSFTAKQWHTLVGSLAKELSTEAKVQWVTRLRSAFAGSKESLAALNARADAKGGRRSVDYLVDSLARLGDKKTNDVKTAVTMTSSPDLATMSTDQLLARARRLRATGQTGAAAKAALGKHIAGKYLASDATAKSFTTRQWSDLVGILANDLSPEARAQWVVKLRSAFANAEAIAGIKYADLRSLVKVLKYLKDADAAEVIFAHLKSSTTWQSYSPEQLCGLLEDAGGSGRYDAAARGQLGEFVNSKYMANTTATKSVPLKQWTHFAHRLRGDLSSEIKKQWIAKLREAFANSGEIIATLGDSDRIALMGALRGLGDADVSNLKGISAEALKDWKTLDAEKIARLADRLSNSDTKTRAEMVAHVDSKYASGPAAARGVTPTQWRTVAGIFRGDLSMAQQARWISVIRGGFVSEDLNINDLFSISATLSSLGDGNSIGFVTAWGEKNESWKSWKLADLARLAGTVRKYSQADKLKTSLTALISTKHIPNTKTIQDAGLRAIAQLVEALGVGFSEDDEKAWIDGIRRAFASSNEMITALGSSQCTTLVNTLTALGDPNAGSLAMAWLASKGDANWTGKSLKEMTAAVMLAASAGDEKGAEMMDKLAATAMSGELKISEKLTICQTFSKAWGQMGKGAKAQQWAMTAYEIAVGTKAARDQADMGTLGMVARILSKSGLTGKDKGYPCFADALAGMARAGKVEVALCKSAPIHCKPLGTAATRQTVRDTLLDSAGVPRLAVGKLLGWTYRTAGEMETWKKYVDARIGDDSVTGDAKAIWLMIKAYDDSIRPRSVYPAAGIRSLKKAVMIAQSQPVRLVVLDELTTYFMRINRPGVAVDIIASIAQQFSGQAAVQLEEINQRARRVHKLKQARDAANLARQKKSHRKAEIRYCQKMLLRAKKRNDREAVTRLEAALAKLQ
jgi:hypothetical protein